jgi:GNAT superfamily N-acetyltransferase
MECFPLTPDRFADMEVVFGERGVARRCFCMYWRRPDGGFTDDRDNRDRFADVADEGPPPGLLGYIEGRPVGWVQVGPRSDFPTLGRSRLLKPVDDSDPWSINCFVVKVGERQQGVGRGLLAAAIEYAKSQDAEVIEAYPVDGPRGSAVDFFTGTLGMFREHGFVEVIRRNDTRPVVRLTV